MKNTSILILIFSLFALQLVHATEVDEAFLKAQIKSLENDQDASGAFYPINCLDKAMTKKCYSDASLFFTGLIAESFQDITHPAARSLKTSTVKYLAAQFKEQKGILRYYETRGKLYKIVKPDVDDNGIVLSILMNYPELADQKLIDNKLPELYKNSVITNTFTKKGSKPEVTYSGKYLSTWMNPTRPFFNDIDLVVNFNGLLAFAKHNKRSAKKDQIDLSGVCSTVNQLMDWSKEDNFDDLISIRHWTKRQPKNYSQWYPSKYAVMYALVRAHIALGEESCIKASYQLVRKHLLTETFMGNIYDKALATAAYARVLDYENLPKDDLGAMIQKIHQDLARNNLGVEPFFFYGAVGYTGSIPMVKTLLIEATATYLKTERVPASAELEEKEFLKNILSEQMDDGSFTALIIPSSPLYNLFVIYMYEYLGQTEIKKPISKKLMEHVFSMQKSSGALAGYPEGPDHVGISTAGYVAGRIIGISENDPRMKKLQQRIMEMGGPQKSDMLTLPFLMIFSLSPYQTNLNTSIDDLFLKLNKTIPWVRVLIHPVLNIISSNQTRILSQEKYPHQIFSMPYEKYAKRQREPRKSKNDKFINWASASLNPDGTLFDYTPTTVPMLMALSNFPDKKAIVAQGIKTIESFQKETRPGQLLQTPGEASIAETFYIANAMLDVGHEHDHSSIRRAEKYLMDHQMKSGGWGFSKNSVHFADSDDTSNSMYFLIRLDQARGKKIRPEVFKALDWLLTLQNSNGGFGTWEKTRNGLIGHLINKVANKKGLVMAESVFEHTARIVVCLSYLKDHSAKAKKAYEDSYNWLLAQQKKDGSFAGTWFINYMFSTSMAMTALGTDLEKGDHAIKKAIKYLYRMQSPDGGFGESPDSFLEGKAVFLKNSSWAQSGLIVSQLHTLNMLTSCKYQPQMQSLLETTHLYLRDEKDGWLNHMDETWTAVTFPKVEYLIYPYIQRLVPWQAYNMHLTSICN
jgi:prenyltransferase beta subunit